jgi:Protein of unknown function (DUF4232)
MSELEPDLRRARDSLGDSDAQTTDAARRAVLDTAHGLQFTAVRPRWSRSRLALATLILALVIGIAFGAGFLIAPSGASGASDGPGFLPAEGWNTFQTGLTTPPAAPSATAANVPLGAEVFSQTWPWKMIAGLGPGELLLRATFYPTGESDLIDKKFPKRELPLSLDDAETNAGLEGQPASVRAYRLLARVNNYNVDLFVFFGSEPAAQTLQLAQEELDRLVIPHGPPPVGTAVSGTCRAEDLRGHVELQGATGSLVGSMYVDNLSTEACTLSGRPTVILRHANGQVISSSEEKAPPEWQFTGGQRPDGWPIVRLQPHGRAFVFLRLTNWCGEPNERVYFHFLVPGGRVLGSAAISLRCDLADQPVMVGVGPFEPPPSS